MKAILISLIIPTKNAGEHLKLFFKSLTLQTYKNFEVIINDDLSTSDDTPKVIKDYSKKLEINYIKKNKMMAQGRREGAKVAKGDDLYHLDADMSLHPKVLGECVEKMKKGYDALIISEVSYGEGFWAKVKAFERSLYIGDDLMESARFFSKKAYWDVGGHDKTMVASEDKDIHLKVKEAGYKIGRIKSPVYHNEGKLSLLKTMKKKYFYGKTVGVFISKHRDHAFKQANTLFRPAYFRNVNKFVKYPILGMGLIIMKSVELMAVVFGLAMARLKGILGL
ncbi:hypothetical protein A2686_03280 [Candidatus Woesebacteria bacterium RIFCSPHIGHO2_01_FULL_38_10]|nr:MAG: hypothetical protein A2686_03280 [Candidatus Woesebacteria bacterium RIFCSPHIGHO2_01_FULL_38_10]